MTSHQLVIQGKRGAYGLTLGLEVHAQIASKAKLFSKASAAFGSAPNTHVALVDVAFPGMLPQLNRWCVLQALKTSLGLDGQVNLTSFFDRKNYFYPDLPQGYQITQFYTPIMENGFLDIEAQEGCPKRVRINRLHIEQDAGKSVHDQNDLYSGIDLNRVGVGLMEIVTEPDLVSPEEAICYLKKLRQILVCLGTSDGSMEEGSLRVDANVSVALPGEPLGTRVEIKNLNSFRFLQQAVLFEAQRQVQCLDNGQAIIQETRLFDTEKKETRAMRSKEDAQEYRYFPDPDLPPLVLTQGLLDKVRAQLPELPDAKKARFEKQLALSSYDAGLVTADLDVTAFFEKALVLLEKATPKMLVNWLMGDVMAAVNESETCLVDQAFTPEYLVQLLELITSKEISGKMAKDLFAESWETGQSPQSIVAKKGLKQMNSPEALMPLIKEVLSDNADKVAAFKTGKDKLFGFFVGQVMKKSEGKANPELLTALLKKSLSQ